MPTPTTRKWAVKVGGASGVVLENVQVSKLKMGYAFPRECTLLFPGKHDEGISHLTNNNEIWLSRDGFTTLDFRGFLEVNSPRGIISEGVEYNVYGLEAAANRYIVKFNGSIDHTYNVDNLPDYTSPNYYGGRWQVGQIMTDVLEHAIGYPSGGSAIPLHHPSSSSIFNTYMPPTILKSYAEDALKILTLELTEFRISAQRFWDCLRHLIEQEDHHGIFIDPSDPSDPRLTIHNYVRSTTVDFKCGQVNKFIEEVEPDEAKSVVTQNKMGFTIVPCKTKIIIEGRGKIQELIPAGLGGSDDGVMIEHQTSPDVPPEGKGHRWIIRDPQRYTPFWEGRLSNGLMGPCLVLNGVPCHADFADWDLETGIVTTSQDLRGFTVEVCTLYLAPFQVIAGPGGDAYDNYGLIREEAIYDDSLLHPTQPVCLDYNLISTYNPGTMTACVTGQYNHQQTSGEEYCMPLPPRDDTPMMQAIADTMLTRLGDERINCTLTVDVADIDTYTLLKAVNLLNLAKWDGLNAQIMAIEVDCIRDQMSVLVTNDIFRTPGYAEWKRRFLLRRDSNSLTRIIDSLRHVTRLGGDTQASRH